MFGGGALLLICLATNKYKIIQEVTEIIKFIIKSKINMYKVIN